MLQTNVLLQQGIAAAKAGKKPVARQFLLQVIEEDPGNESCWLWLAITAESREERVGYLQKALTINPHNPRTKAALVKLQKQQSIPRLAHPPQPTWQCPLCQVSTTTAVNRCPACGALLTLADLQAVLNNQTANQARIQKAIYRLKKTPLNGNAAHINYYLGLAYLNLNRPDEAIPYLQAAIPLRPKDTLLQAQVKRLMQRETAVAKPAVAKPAAAKPAAAKPAIPSQGTIMIVDDSHTIRRLVSMTLKRQNYEVIVAVDGLDALAKLNDGTPDLILLDITMPRMDGYQVCKIVKGNKEISHVPVVMLSGKDGFFDKVRGRLAGATDYVTKPFEPQELVKTVKQHMKQKA